MRVLICGDRNWYDPHPIYQLIRELPDDAVIIEGEARGADRIARIAAEERGLEVERYPADWARYGRAAGPIRNKQMLTEGKPDRVVAFHDNTSESKGTLNMIRQAEEAGIPTEVRTTDGNVVRNQSAG